MVLGTNQTYPAFSTKWIRNTAENIKEPLCKSATNVVHRDTWSGIAQSKTKSLKLLVWDQEGFCEIINGRKRSQGIMLADGYQEEFRSEL